jgi:NAD(P)-dependent dehydrogenase (short-subunit alcohol dehydrogenase family)
MMADRQFEGKVAIVTGGASGIGAACAITLAQGGARLVVADLDQELGERIVSEIKASGSDAIFTRTDVGQPAAVEAMVDAAITSFGRLDVAVNNAGIGGESNPTGNYSVDGWRKVIDINLNSVFYCMRYEIPRMLESGGGAIVNMASILGSVGFANSPAYVAAKHGVVGLTKSAALEYAKQGVRINSVGPGFIATPLVTDALDEATRTFLSGLHAVGRMGESQEVANLVVFLCSDQASFLTGGYYLVDGGYTAQ